MNIVRVIWRKIYHIYETEQLKKEIACKYDLQGKKDNIVIFGTPNHGNLGDYAIFLAEKKILNEYRPDSHIFDINMAVFYREVESLKKLLRPRDLLILTGGGNLGNQYMDDENIRRKVIQSFPKNRIVIFPQTMFFTEDALGKREKEITRQIYNSHSHLLIAARDELSYHEMHKIFNTRVMLVPDVVLTWGSLQDEKRKGALLVLRSDVEGKLSKDQVQEIEKKLTVEYGKVEKTDTVVGQEISIENFESELKKKWHQFEKAELVVTDRLHGMIFAAIAQTPCLVLNNYNHKLRETYKWIQNLDYIQFLSDMNVFDESVQKMKQLSHCKYEVSEIDRIYKEFLKEIFHG